MINVLGLLVCGAFIAEGVRCRMPGLVWIGVAGVALWVFMLTTGRFDVR